MAIHPIKTTEAIRDTYIKYLLTIKPFRDKWLRQQFKAALSQSETLIKGPIVEISPPYKLGFSIGRLVEKGVLSSRFKSLCSPFFLPYDRPLYKHQQIAIKKIVELKRNVVVSTGTGSGKTETFLIPILNYLLKEQEKGTLNEPGVRALLLYPMNALANDQVKRLRYLLKEYPAITFGRYIGDTKYEKEAARENFEHNYPEEPLIPNELLSRNEMHKNPPHILLTNYAMLEYLLLRPEDSSFFDGKTGKHWRFIVLDEAHVYNGANATEMAMLLRRLQYRVVGEKLNKLQIIATSATLGRGESDFPAVAEFATNLFNQKFEWVAKDKSKQDVIAAKRLKLDKIGNAWGKGTPSIYTELLNLVSDFLELENNEKRNIKTFINQINEILNKFRIPEEVITTCTQYAYEDLEFGVQRFLYSFLRGDDNIHRVQRLLMDKPALLRKIALKVFPDYHASSQALIDLVSLAIVARPNPDNSPLLPARYHVFARALEGAFICMNKEAHEDNGESSLPRLFLRRYKFCPHCGSRIFELANCTRCGASYLIGDIESGKKLIEEGEDNKKVDEYRFYLTQNSVIYENELEARNLSYFLLIDNLTNIADVDEDQVISSKTSIENINYEQKYLCPKCGCIWDKNNEKHCDCDIDPISIGKINLGKKHTLQRCVVCSTQASSGIVYRFLTGQNAPVSILASTLYQFIPPSKDEKFSELPGDGRKLLHFSDSRQSAAFFAPYLERAHRRNLRRRLIVKTITEDSNLNKGDIRLDDLLPRVLKRAGNIMFFERTLSQGQREETIAIWLMQEFSPLDRRISLEGLGLLQFIPIVDQDWEPPDFLALSLLELNKKEAFDLITAVLNTIRYQGAVTYLLSDSMDIIKNPAFYPRNKIFYLRQNKSDRRKGIFSWMPAERYSNTRFDLLKRIIKKRLMDSTKIDSLARELLENLWIYLSSENSPWSITLHQESLGNQGIVYRINHKMWEIKSPLREATDDWYICDRCQNITPYNIHRTCPTYGCDGTLQPLKSDAEQSRNNIYRNIYLYSKPVPLRAEEHTAQWTTAEAAHVQNRFIRGEINVLSCSTTFELGVDVGELQAVVMRNVPPTTANYIQRAGRAGRRTDSAAYVLTFAQRRSHDLSYYKSPEDMVSGKIKPPIATLTNEKIIRRHLHSVVFSFFFKSFMDNHGYWSRKVGDFFAPNEVTNGESGPDLLSAYLKTRPESIRETLGMIIPNDVADELGVKDWLWIDKLISPKKEGVLDITKEEVCKELDEFQMLEQQAVNNKKYKLAAHFQKVQKLIRERDLLGFLGIHNVLPKYGFPTDVVSLRTNHLKSMEVANNIQLERDLKMAISEFAPGGEVVAAKRIWTSVGVYKIPGRDWVKYYYVICPNCKQFHYSITTKELPKVCTCGYSLPDNRIRKFIIPEQGFIAGNKTKPTGEKPPKRIYSSRVYFAEYKLPHSQTSIENPFEVDLSFDIDNIKVEKRYSRFGWLTIVNNGYKRGFKICSSCGYAEPVDIISLGRKRKINKKHTNPRTGIDCNGSMEIFDLGHRFMTDVLELKFSLFLSHNSEIYSLLYAILDGASDALGIRREDIDGTTFPQGLGQSPSYIIYDNVPGGAGHVKRIYDNLKETLEAAYKRVNNCECGIDTSCYNCLRNYQNQYYHDILQRGSAVNSLGKVLGYLGNDESLDYF